MKILLVVSVQPGPGLVAFSKQTIKQPAAKFELVSILPPARPLDVSRHLVVDRSIVPRRPIRAVSTVNREVAAPHGVRGAILNVLARGRAGLERLPIPDRWRATPARMLAVACRTSPVLARAAAAADVVVAVDDGACWGVWELSRHSQKPRFVNRIGNVDHILSTPRPTTAEP